MLWMISVPYSPEWLEPRSARSAIISLRQASASSGLSIAIAASRRCHMPLTADERFA